MQILFITQVNSATFDKFLIAMIRTQKSLHNWNEFLVDVLKMTKKSGKIDCQYFLKKYPPESISKTVPAWVTYKEDRIVSDFIDKLGKKKINFIGTNKDKIEFVFRFILGQLGHDWEATIMMIWEMLGTGKSLNIKKLNKEMKNFDYLNLFE